jgi:hypothetical protein
MNVYVTTNTTVSTRQRNNDSHCQLVVKLPRLLSISAAFLLGLPFDADYEDNISHGKAQRYNIKDRT